MKYYIARLTLITTLVITLVYLPSWAPVVFPKQTHALYCWKASFHTHPDHYIPTCQRYGRSS